MAGHLGMMSRERTSPVAHFLVKVYAVAANTFLESIRQPVYAVILGGATALILITPYITFFTLNDSPRLVKEMGLATIMLSGMLLAAFSASKVISEEIENRTVLTVVSKPVGRTEFILGKYIGVLLGIVVGVYMLSLALVLTIASGASEAEHGYQINIRVALAMFGAMFLAVGYGVYSNFFNDKPFPSRTLGAAIPLFTLCFIIFLITGPGEYREGAFIDYQMIFACFMLMWSILIIASVAVAVSTRLSVVMNVALCSGVFILGLLSDYLFKELGRGLWIADALYRVVPNFQIFWVGHLLAANVPISFVHIMWSTVYALCYLGVFLFLAMLLFQRRQVS